MRVKATSGMPLHRYLWLIAALVPSTLTAQPPPQANLPVGFPGGTPVGMPTPPVRSMRPPQQAARPATTAPAPPPVSQLPAMPVAPVAPPVPQTPASSPPEHASVRYANGLVSIQASNSSLNQILRSIMRQTGLQISGGVQEERVYGNYGPARLGPLLTNLLAGTGSNVIFVPANGSKAAQLILSPRNGGSMPPPPGVSANPALDDDPSTPPPTLADTPMAPVSDPSVRAPAPDSGVLTTPSTSITIPPVPQPAVTSTVPAVPPAPAEPPKPRTPEQIVEDIMRRRAAQAQFEKEMKKAKVAPVPTATPAQPDTQK